MVACRICDLLPLSVHGHKHKASKNYESESHAREEVRKEGSPVSFLHAPLPLALFSCLPCTRLCSPGKAQKR